MLFLILKPLASCNIRQKSVLMTYFKQTIILYIQFSINIAGIIFQELLHHDIIYLSAALFFVTRKNIFLQLS